MDKIIEFPESMIPQWRIYARTMGGILADLGLPDDEISHVLNVLQPIYLRYSKPESCTGKTADEVLVSINRWVHQQITGLLLQVATRELELYRLGARTKSTTGPTSLTPPRRDDAASHEGTA